MGVVAVVVVVQAAMEVIAMLQELLLLQLLHTHNRSMVDILHHRLRVTHRARLLMQHHLLMVLPHHRVAMGAHTVDMGCSSRHSRQFSLQQAVEDTAVMVDSHKGMNRIVATNLGAMVNHQPAPMVDNKPVPMVVSPMLATQPFSPKETMEAHHHRETMGVLHQVEIMGDPRVLTTVHHHHHQMEIMVAKVVDLTVV